MFVVGVLISGGWAIQALFEESELTEFARTCLVRVLMVLFWTSTGIFHMLGYHRHVERRREGRG